MFPKYAWFCFFWFIDMFLLPYLETCLNYNLIYSWLTCIASGYFFIVSTFLTMDFSKNYVGTYENMINFITKSRTRSFISLFLTMTTGKCGRSIDTYKIMKLPVILFIIKLLTRNKVFGNQFHHPKSKIFFPKSHIPAKLKPIFSNYKCLFSINFYTL